MRRAGFTLIELIFVIAIVTLMVGVLVPSLYGSYEAAQSARCKTNLHQLAIACQNYSMSTGHFPWGAIEPGQHDKNYWDNEYHHIVYRDENPRLHGVSLWSDYSSYCWDFKRRNGQIGWSSGEMTSGIPAFTMFGCPKCSRERTDNWDGNHITGYNYNVCYLGYVENDSGQRRYPTAWNDVREPSRVVVFGDGGYAGGPNKFMRAPFQDKQYDNSAASLRKAGTQAFRHGRDRKRHCNMVFVDGHVEEFYNPYKAGGKPGWVDKSTRSAFISSGNGIYGPRGFGVDDDDEPRR